MNYEKTDDVKNANFIIINTCCVRENAEDKLFGKLGELKRIKEEKGTIITIRWLHDARKTYNEKNQRKLSFC